MLGPLYFIADTSMLAMACRCVIIRGSRSGVAASVCNEVEGTHFILPREDYQRASSKYRFNSSLTLKLAIVSVAALTLGR